MISLQVVRIIAQPKQVLVLCEYWDGCKTRDSWIIL